MEEGRFISDEPAKALTQQLQLPNQDEKLSEDVKSSFIEELAAQLDIDPKYISLSRPSADFQESMSKVL